MRGKGYTSLMQVDFLHTKGQGPPLTAIGDQKLQRLHAQNIAIKCDALRNVGHG
tara:strand:+ start:3586 stop:3747 length:162 start_codon:yes stop_codon:yes gene_type:complete